MDIEKLKDIDSLTDEQLEELIASEELKCKIVPSTGELKCITPEVINRAIARLKNPVKRIVFEVPSETEPDTHLNPTES
ncbi:hypothetical protein ES708_31234 [subsurface metagenome]